MCPENERAALRLDRPPCCLLGLDWGFILMNKRDLQLFMPVLCARP